MLLLLVLLVYTCSVTLLGPRLVAGRAWSTAAPRLGLLLCQAIGAAVLSGVLMISAMAAVSVQHLRVDVGHLLHACAVAAWNSATHQGIEVTTVAGAVALLALGHLGKTAASSASSSRRVRRRQRDGLALVGRRDPQDGYTLVTSDHPFAYCVPGGGGRIVVSTAAAAALDDEELAAVLAHERAHLRGRHHALTLTAQVLARALPVRPMQALHAEVVALVELAADDRACRVADREALLSALLRLGAPRATTPGLAANGGGTLSRAMRLAAPAAAGRRGPRTAAAWGVALALVAVPWVVAVTPVLLAVTGHCER